jgi:NADPH2 dehydrogenase
VQTKPVFLYPWQQNITLSEPVKKGSLLITEATYISATAAGRSVNSPGIFTSAQIAGWKQITDAVHRKKSFIFLQLWAVGRAARQEVADASGIDIVSSSAVPIKEGDAVPRSMTEVEIEAFIAAYGQAARNALEAGFDGVEVHAANGYLIDQFIQDTCNQRVDEWGGSIENRARFCLRIMDEVVKSVGSNRTGVRLSPFSPYQGMGMADTIPQFTHVIRSLRPYNLAYLHLVDPIIHGTPAMSLEFAIQEWDKDVPIILNGGYDHEQAQETVESIHSDRKVAISFGRHFTSNPDLPFRLQHGLDLTPPCPPSFYAAKQAHGYVNYPFHEKFSTTGTNTTCIEII